MLAQRALSPPPTEAHPPSSSSCVAHGRKPTNPAGGRRAGDELATGRTLPTRRARLVTVRVARRFPRDPLMNVSDRMDSATLENRRLDQIKPVAVEEWLNGISGQEARGEDAELDERLFHHAMRYEWTDRIRSSSCVRARSGRKCPDVLELAELQLLLSKLSVRRAHAGSARCGDGSRSANCLRFVGRTLTSKTWS